MENSNEDSFILDEDILHDENYTNFKDNIKCSKCNKIFKEPMMCKSCQTVICKSCTIDGCPNNCIKNEFCDCIDKKGILSSLKFRCKNCKEEIKYNDVESHLKKGCKKNLSYCKLIDMFYKEKKLKKISADEAKDLVGQNKKMNHISSKFLNFNKI